MFCLSVDDWIKKFDSIKTDLGVSGKMFVDKELYKFVESKSKKDNLQERFSLPDLLDCLEIPIRKIYDELLDEEKEEFDENFAMSGEDQIFFIKYFLPSAMLKTYQAVHKTVSVTECLNDLFSLGSGSATYDLFQEVVGVCCLCAGSFDNLTSAERISDCNKFVIFKQFENSFKSPNLFIHGKSLQMAHAKVTLDIIDLNDKKRSCS